MRKRRCDGTRTENYARAAVLVQWRLRRRGGSYRRRVQIQRDPVFHLHRKADNRPVVTNEYGRGSQVSGFRALFLMSDFVGYARSRRAEPLPKELELLEQV